MKTLQELKNLGVKELSVKNGEAIAVNPHDPDKHFLYSFNDHDEQEMLLRQRKNHEEFLEEKLPPILAPSVADGTYQINTFREIKEFYVTDKICFRVPLRGYNYTEIRTFLIKADNFYKSQTNLNLPI